MIYVRVNKRRVLHVHVHVVSWHCVYVHVLMCVRVRVCVAITLIFYRFGGVSGISMPM